MPSGYNMLKVLEFAVERKAKGLHPACTCQPYESWHTYRQWKDLGMQVMKGEHGCAVMTFVKVEKEDGTSHSKPWFAVVFCACQVQPMEKVRE